MESKNNPFAQNNEQHYQGYHGKKVEEKVNRPEDPKPKYQLYMI